MKLPALIITALFFSLTLQAREEGADKKAATLYNAAATQLQFIENKGQIADQYGAVRKDIDYKLNGGAVTLFVGNGQLHYQWLQGQPNTKSEKLNPKALKNKKSPLGDLGVSIYRMDVTLLGANKNATVLAEDILAYTENYYLPATPDGATAHSYMKISYKNIYPHIDWVLYTSADGGTGIKYDFVVHPGGNVKDIRIQYNGANSIQIKDGAIIATTPYGSTTDDAPYSYYINSKEAIKSAYVLADNIVSFDLGANSSHDGIVIDPKLKWGTYYGGSDDEIGVGVAADTIGNAYMVGGTKSTTNIATTGAFQTTLNAATDGFLVKFNSLGVRQWATYYGGSSDDYFASVACDSAGNVFVAGYTQSTGMASTGSYQSALAGNTDALLIKFNASGTRLWASYYGGTDIDNGYVVTCDPMGDVYFGGQTASTSGIATTGAYQTTLTSSITGGFLTKFSSAGARQWGTYYGSNAETIQAITCDANGYIIAAGRTKTNGLSTSGVFMTTVPSGVNVISFVVKFNYAGQRQWCTYYGGNNLDEIQGIAADPLGNIYVGGYTSSTGMATTGAFQTSLAGGNGDGFIGKLTKDGNRVWATYYGGTGNNDDITKIIATPDNKIYAMGRTISSSGIATTNGYQTFNGGGADMYLCQFSASGKRLYGTYYGGPGIDCGYGIGWIENGMAFSKGLIYISGTTTSTTGIATTGAHQTTYGGAVNGQRGDAMLVQFEADTAVYIVQPFKDTAKCAGDTIHIPYKVINNFRTTNVFTIQLSNASGSFATPTNLAVISGNGNGQYNWVVPNTVVAGNAYRIRILASAPLDTFVEEFDIKLAQSPVVTATSNSPVCSGNTLNLFGSSSISGVNWSWIGPGGFTSSSQNPSIAAAQTTHSGDYILTASNNFCIGKDTVTVVVNQTPITPTASNNGPLCVGSDLQLTATNSTPGASYVWTGPSFSSTTQNPLITSAPLSASGVYTVHAVLGSCNSGTSTTTVSIVNGPSVSIYPSPKDTICGNPTGSATFNASSTGGAGYQWYKNGSVIPGATGTTYAATGIQTGDIFYVKLTPGTGAACNTPVNSNQITMTVMPYITPTVSISVSPDSTAWSGVMLTFTAIATNAGNKPTYQWKVNGVSMAGATSNVWGASNLNDKDKVTCEVTSNYICPQPQKVTSNAIGIKIKTGINNNLEASNVKIYPNPTQTTLTVEGVAKGTMLQLKDVLGRQVIHTIATQTKTVLHTSQLTAGNYLLILTTADGEVMTEKVLKD